MEKITLEILQKEIENSDIPILVDFWAPWCGPCQMMQHIIEDITAKFINRLVVIKIDVDLHQDISNYYEINAVPTLILFHKGKIKERLVGFQSHQSLENLIKKVL